MDELRDQIWDYLYSNGSECPLEDLAAWSGRDVAEITEVVDHSWFRVVNGRAGVAYAIGPLPK